MSTRQSRRRIISSMGGNTVQRSQKYDFEWAFGWNRLGLDFMGIWPRQRSLTHKSSSLVKQLRAPLMILWITLGLFVPQMFALSQISQDLLLIMDNLISCSGGVLAIIKLLVIWNNRTQLRPIVEWVRKDWSDARSLTWELDVMLKQARRARIFTIGGYAIMLASVVCFATTPLFGINIRIINNITDPYGKARFFPLQTVYPFEAFGTPCFELLYVMQVVSIALTGFSFSVPDFFFGALAFHASAQYEILAGRFKLLFPQDLQLIEMWMLHGKRAFRKQLRQSVQRHVHLIRFVASLEDLFNLVVLSHVICLSLEMCILEFGLITSLGSRSGSVPVMQVITFGGTILNLMIHMLIYCFTSEVLVYHSSGLHEAIYRSCWYLLPAKYSRNIIPVMIRAKIPLQLTVGKFVNLSLSTYCTIIKTSAGYVSVLLAANR